MLHVQFDCQKELSGFLPSPVSAIRAAPDFYKNIKPQITGNPQSSTVKRCVPFLDALSAGYILPLWCDMFFTVSDGEVNVDVPPSFPMETCIASHSIDQMPKHPYANGSVSDMLLKLLNPWIVTTDEGVSCLFTSPLNHLEKRFKLLDGIVDTDNYYNQVNFPFIWLAGDGEFLLKKGTPIAQVIPFRREDTSHAVGIVDDEKARVASGRLSTQLKDGYRDNFWHKRKEQSDE